MEAESDADKIEHAYNRWRDSVIASPILEQSGVAAKIRGNDNVVLEVDGAGEFLSVTYPGANANKLTAIGRSGEYGVILCQSYGRGEGGGIRPPIAGLEQANLQIDGPQNRNWHVIADLNQPEEDIARQTAHSALLWARNSGSADQARKSSLSNRASAKGSTPQREMPKGGGPVRATAASSKQKKTRKTRSSAPKPARHTSAPGGLALVTVLILLPLLLLVGCTLTMCSGPHDSGYLSPTDAVRLQLKQEQENSNPDDPQ